MSIVNPAILHYCKYQERCHSEVRSKLFELAIYGHSAEEQIALLVELGVLNEERFARAYARGHWRMKQWGRNKIRYSLTLKKVSDYCIRKAMTEIDDEEYMQGLARIAARKITELRGERSKAVKKGKVYRYLVQKGYEQDLVNDVIKAELD